MSRPKTKFSTSGTKADWEKLDRERAKVERLIFQENEAGRRWSQDPTWEPKGKDKRAFQRWVGKRGLVPQEVAAEARLLARIVLNLRQRIEQCPKNRRSVAYYLAKGRTQAIAITHADAVMGLKARLGRW